MTDNKNISTSFFFISHTVVYILVWFGSYRVYIGRHNQTAIYVTQYICSRVHLLYLKFVVGQESYSPFN